MATQGTLLHEHPNQKQHCHCHPPAIQWELRMRFVTAFAWVIGFSAMNRHLVIICGTALSLAAMVYLGIPLRRICKRIFIVAPFLLISFFTLLISDGIPIGQEALAFASLIALRIIACVFVVTLISVDDIKMYLNSFAAVRLPHALTSTLFLTQRYVHLIGQQLVAIKNALLSRLFHPHIRLKTFKVYGQIAGGMTIKSIDRSDHVQRAMESRGFQGRVWTDRSAPICAHDIFKTLLSLCILTLFILADQGGFR